MMRTKWMIELGLAAALALATPMMAQHKPEDSGKPDDRGGVSAPSAPAPSQPADDKGVDPAGKADDKGVDPAGKADDKGVDPAGKADDKGVDPAGKHDDKGVDSKPEDVRREHMNSSPDGDSLHCRGDVEIRRELQVEHPRERFRVELEAQVEDGMAFVVWVNAKPAATLIVKDGRGELQLENEPGKAQPAGVFPVTEIKNVSVMSNTGVLVLRKDF